MALPDHNSIGTVLKLLDAIRRMQLMMKRGLLHEINSHVSCEGMSRVKSQQERKLKDVDPSQVAGEAAVTSSEVQNVMSCVIASFEKTVNALDLFGNFLQAPSGETSEKLKQLCDREKSTEDELLTTRKIDETFDFLRSFLIDETKKSQDLNSEKHAVLELPPTINSVSREASEKDLEPNCEQNFQLNSNEKHRPEKLQLITTYNNHHDKFQDHFIMEQFEQNPRNKNKWENYEDYGIYHSSSAKAKQPIVYIDNYKLFTENDTLGHPNDHDNSFQKKPRVNKSVATSMASGNGFTQSQVTNKNADVSKATSSKQNVQGTLDNEKSKKVKSKMSAKNFNIPDEDIDTAQLRDIEILNTTVNALKNKVHSLKVENQELLAELGQVLFEKAAKEREEREERKSELFQQIYRPSLTKAKQSVVSTSNDKAATEYDTLGYPNDNDSALRESSYANENASTSNRCETCFSKAKATNENVDPTSPFSTAVSSKQAVQGAEFLVKEDDDQSGKKEIVTNDKDEGELHDGDQNGAGIFTDNNENENQTTQTSSGEGINQSGSISRPSNAARTSKDGTIEQSSTQQSYESLSFSVQQDYSNKQEKISLSNVPPTSVATTLYNNYKLLLLCLGQMLLSNDVTKLMTWATQNFPIVNPQNATHVLFQLDENEVINASDLSQLRHFFESIVRFDLVYVIDAFLLGDYGILRQITTSKKRDVSTTQTPQNGTTSRYQNLFNAASNSQFSLRDSSLRAENSNEPQSSVLQQKQQAFPTLYLNNPTPNDAKFVPRSPNENQSSAYGLQSLKSGATGFTASQQVVVDGHVASKLHYCFVRHGIHEKEISYQVAINAKKDYYILQAKVFSECFPPPSACRL